MQNIREITEKFSDVKVLVIGDVMLDRYWWESVERISPEAPVPVVRLEKTTHAAGGAANVAANIVGLGAKAFLVGIVGEDTESQNLAEILEQAGISNKYLIPMKNRQTAVKTRIIAHSQQVVRLDHEDIKPISSREVENVLSIIENLVDKSDVVIVSDYAKGFLTENLLVRLITKCAVANRKILVDPKGKDYTKYKKATILTPNRKEALEACGLDESTSDAVEMSGKTLLEKIETEAILITQGEKGMSLFENQKEIQRFEAMAREVYDVTGAGDTVIAALGVSIGAGLSFLEAAQIANIAAGLVVEQVGTTAITKEMLHNALTENP